MDDLFDDIDVDAVLGVEPEPARPPPASYNSRRHKVVCKHWLRGLCKKGDDCDFLHKLDHDRMPDCWYFTQFGECGNKECLFQHVRPDEKTDECPWYARGFCKHGPRCRHRHTQKKPCPKYLAGVCPECPECSFGHPKYELPSTVGSAMVPRGTMTAFEREIAVTCYKCWQKGHYANRCPNQRVPGPMEQTMSTTQQQQQQQQQPPPPPPSQAGGHGNMQAQTMEQMMMLLGGRAQPQQPSMMVNGVG